MKLNELKPAEGSTKTKKRLGRGEGSGSGGTASKGHKGQKSRSGYKSKRGGEGGQMPLQRRVPKFGFTNVNRKEFKGINLDSIQALVDSKKITSLDVEMMVANGLAGKNDRVKILGRGELNAAVEVKAHAFSATAKKAIEEKGGKAETV